MWKPCLIIKAVLVLFQATVCMADHIIVGIRFSPFSYNAVGLWVCGVREQLESEPLMELLSEHY